MDGRQKDEQVENGEKDANLKTVKPTDTIDLFRRHDGSQKQRQIEDEPENIIRVQQRGNAVRVEEVIQKKKLCNPPEAEGRAQSGPALPRRVILAMTPPPQADGDQNRRRKQLEEI